MLKKLPNLLSLARLVLLTPAMVVVAWSGGSRAWFLALFAAALLTDALDGFLARRLGAQSDLGRRLDSWGDYTMTAAAALGVWRLWPEVARREWPWFVVVLAGCFAIVAYGLIRWRRVLGYHTWLAKGMAMVLPVALLVLLAGWSAVPFHTAVVLQVLCAGEELVIACLLPGYSGEVPSAWHARRMRRLRAQNPAAASDGL
ncbi:MAG: CDP-alcohol phosphatidyltransferase family protein [Opitutaceae bacterium]